MNNRTETDRLEQIARTLLYEGYLLWPYRRSSIKNRRRWTIGGVYPADFDDAATSGDRADLLCECLIESGAAPVLDINIRFLHRVVRQAAVWDGASLEEVDDLRIGERRYLTWDEAVERSVAVRADDLPTDAREIGLAGASNDPAPVGVHTVHPITIPAGREEEWLHGPSGERAGALIRSWERLEGVLEVAVEQLDDALYRVRTRLINRTSAAGLDREAALGRTFLAAHLVLEAVTGEFVSLLDPPAQFADAAAVCRNEGCWPVLVGEEGERHTILASPVVVYDYPQVAPESPGDLFDGTEIDQLLILNVLGLTDAEKEEMRASDPRGREILERSEGLSPDELLALFGAIREYREVEADEA